MSTIEFVTERNVLDIEIIGPFKHPGGYSREDFRIAVSHRGHTLGEHLVEVTDMVRHGMEPYFDQNIADTLLTLVRPRLQALQYDGRHSIVTDNALKLLEGRVLSEEEQECEIAKVLWRYGYEKRNWLSIPKETVSISTGLSPDDVERTLEYFIQRGWVEFTSQSGNDISVTKPNGTAELEKLMRKGIEPRFPPFGYFHRVPLRPEFKRPYVFVLMPFRDEEFPQRKFEKHIRPVLEWVTDLDCWRADDLQNQLLITDQIYTQIAQASVIVAEISSLNPNVMIEIGVALANNKQVYILYDKGKLARLPFYIDKIPCFGYSDDKELRQELEKVRVDSPTSVPSERDKV